MSPRKRKPKTGDLIKVVWLDAAGYVNEDAKDAKVPMAWNIGVLLEDNEKFFKIQTGGYSEESYGDFTSIPKAWTDEVTVVAKKGDF